MTTSIKLSITIDRHLAAHYSAASRKRIGAALKAWIEADRKRGIETIHLALDDGAAMAKFKLPAVTAPATAIKIKRALDALCAQLKPDYVCLFGSHAIVPMFAVPNPSYSPEGDDDKDVHTDNPYASSTPYVAKNLKSYLVPDRVVGRIPDLPGDDDPAWFIDALKRATAWKPKPPSFYKALYAVVCDEWKQAGAACLQYIGAAGNDLQISPPLLDKLPTARRRLARPLHLIKCHGAKLDPRFYGQKGETYPEAMRSSSLASRIPEGTLAGSMCCYGAQIYSVKDPVAQLAGSAPMASAYLRHGAIGFTGATRIAWVGTDEMMCADWIVARYLKSVLRGASLGRAFLEARQDYVQWLATQGQHADKADHKTLLEFVLLGDPALQAVTTGTALAATTRGAVASASPLLLQERHQRRLQQAMLAQQMRRQLPQRRAAEATHAQAGRLFEQVAPALSAADRSMLAAASAQVEQVSSSAAAPALRSASAAAATPRESLQFYWTARLQRADERSPPAIRLLRVETDTEGRVVRMRLLHSA